MVDLVRRRLRRAPAPIALPACLLLLVFSVYGEALATERDAEESLVEALVTDVNAFWEGEFISRGYPYSPAKMAFVFDEPANSGCGPVSPDEGPLYCVLDQTLYYPVNWLYDGQDLAAYGRSVMGWAIAHEMGHHAQEQMDEYGIQGWDSISLEQAELQADCFAGAWANRASEQFEVGDIEAVLGALMTAGGPGHGTAPQRIAAFGLGYDTGDTTRCLALYGTIPA